VGQEPGETECIVLEPLTGPSGNEWERGIESVGWLRPLIDTNNVLACRPPLPLKFYLGKLANENKRRQKAGEPLVPDPITCCSPRLLNETAGYHQVVPLGGLAARVLVPQMRGSFESIRGKMVELQPLPPGVEPPSRNYVPGRKLLATYNPARVLRDRGLRKVFRNDLDRARRFWIGDLRWADPWILTWPSPDQIHRFLSEVFWEPDKETTAAFRQLVPSWTGSLVHGHDTETNFAEGWEAELHCVQIGTPEHAIVIPFRSRVDPGKSFYTPEMELWIRSRLVGWAQDPRILKIGHNSGYFDRMVFEQTRHLGTWPRPHLDTILVKRSAQPDTPHNLGFVGSFYTDVHDWKGDHTATQAKSDEELWHYGGIDESVTCRAAEPMAKEVLARGQAHIVRLDHKVQEVTVGATRLGMLIDQEKRAVCEKKYMKRVRGWAYQCRVILEQLGVSPDGIVDKLPKKKRARVLRDMGLAQEEEAEGWLIAGAGALGEEFVRWNPASHVQLRWLLFEHFGLEPPSDLRPEELLTSSMELSTGDVVLRALLQRGHIAELLRKFIRCVRGYRKDAKILGTYLIPLRPGSHRRGDGVLHEDGRVHPRWLNFIPITGRWASRDPNAQNIIKFLRAMFIPAPGHVFVGADKDQLELRIAAMLWGIRRYLDAFETLEDAHQATMAMIFGEGDIALGIDKMMALEGAPSAYGKKDFEPDSFFDKMRVLDKTTQFGGQYGARGPTLHRIITKAENAKGEFLFGHLTIGDVEALRESWLAGCPEFEQGWEKEKKEALLQGYLLEPFTGRRRDFVDGGDNLSEIANFKVQGGAAGILNEETVEVAEAIPFGCWSPYTGINNQCHDALMVEAPEDKAQTAKGLMTEIMGERRYPGWTLPFTSKPKVGHNWLEVC